MILRKLLFLMPLLILGATGCDSSKPIAITEKRAIAGDEQEVALGATSKERFAMVRQMMGMADEEDHSGHNHEEGEHDHDQAENAPLVYKLPEGWTKKPGSQFRTLNFAFGKEQEGECYVSRVGGGLQANLNRWRGQMGLEPDSKEKIDALPKRLLFGMEATYIVLDGKFKGMGMAEAKSDYRMVGLVLSMPDVSFFIKMTGPKTLLLENEKNFTQFCESLKLVKGGEHE